MLEEFKQYPPKTSEQIPCSEDDEDDGYLLIFNRLRAMPGWNFPVIGKRTPAEVVSDRHWREGIHMRCSTAIRNPSNGASKADRPGDMGSS